MNKRGVALIFAYLVIMVLTIMGSAFLARSISENNTARWQSDSARAFWIAESGLAQAYFNWANSIAQPVGAQNFSGGTYTINVASLPQVSVTGNFGNAQRTVEAFFIGIPLAFQNTLSVGGNLTLSGLLARVEVYGKTRVSGSYSKSALASDYFQDRQTGVAQTNTTIPIPDYDNNGTANEFGDFVQFGRKTMQDYSADQVVYVQNTGTVNIFPNSTLVGKRVIFVEGSAPGEGNVNIFFDATWQDYQDLTVISTGTITYVEPLQFQENSRLSTVSWNNYTEASIFRSQHESMVYAHGNTSFIDILEWGSTTGNVISNGNLSLNEVLTYEKFYYSSRAADGDLSPGFQWLSAATGSRRMMNWQE
ncbi:MAG: hypothetical protein PHT31_04725 [Candidatus Omnitrophica bacterium]|nr:hypothetical protein [Candidatus Omnitrophota bacterium]MDD5653450.1 hypothetical protein [Candidatus Omnitrophota bacterium]